MGAWSTFRLQQTLSVSITNSSEKKERSEYGQHFCVLKLLKKEIKRFKLLNEIKDEKSCHGLCIDWENTPKILYLRDMSMDVGHYNVKGWESQEYGGKRV